MKTTEELLEMSGNDLLKYCESLKYFEIDYDNFHILTAHAIIITKVEYNKIHKQFELSYHFENSNIYDDNFKRVIQSMAFTACRDYCGLFETEQDAINAAKQRAEKEILGQIYSRKLQIKELKKKLEILDNNLVKCDLDLEECIQKYKDKFEDYPSLLSWISIQTYNKKVSPPEFFEMDEETTYYFNCWGHNSRWKNVFWNYLNNNAEKCIEKCRILNTLPNQI